MHLKQKLDDYIAAEMQRKHIPGLSLAVIKDGTIETENHYGLANVELQVPTSSETVYEIVSITKAFTATAIMLLVEDGVLQLDAPLTQFSPGVPDVWNAVTVWHLLTHTSGVSQWDAGLDPIRPHQG